MATMGELLQQSEAVPPAGVNKMNPLNAQKSELGQPAQSEIR